MCWSRRLKLKAKSPSLLWRPPVSRPHSPTLQMQLPHRLMAGFNFRDTRARVSEPWLQQNYYSYNVQACAPASQESYLKTPLARPGTWDEKAHGCRTKQAASVLGRCTNRDSMVRCLLCLLRPIFFQGALTSLTTLAILGSPQSSSRNSSLMDWTFWENLLQTRISANDFMEVSCKISIRIQSPITIWLFNIAMENGPFIDGLPIKNGDFPWLC